MGIGNYTNKEMADFLKETQTKISYYTNEGIITPEVDDAKGRGKVRRYSVTNVLDFLIARELARNGMSLNRIKRVMPQIPFVFKTKVVNGVDGKQSILIIYNQHHVAAKVIGLHSLSECQVAVPGIGYGSALIINVSKIWEAAC